MRYLLLLLSTVVLGGCVGPWALQRHQRPPPPTDPVTRTEDWYNRCDEYAFHPDEAWPECRQYIKSGERERDRWNAAQRRYAAGIHSSNPTSMTPEEIAAMEETARQQRAAMLKEMENMARAGKRIGAAIAGVPEPDPCCKHCGSTSQPCGDTCISLNYTCYTPPGCACY
jgi:hypothetical protein